MVLVKAEKELKYITTLSIPALRMLCWVFRQGCAYSCSLAKRPSSRSARANQRQLRLTCRFQHLAMPVDT